MKYEVMSEEASLCINLKVARKRARLSQDALSRLADVSRTTIVQIEQRDGDPRISTICTLSRALMIPTSDLFLAPETFLLKYPPPKKKSTRW